MLIITDAASNVTRLLDIIRLVDVQVAQEELQIIPISYADAGELATILTQLFASGRVRFAAPGTAARRRRPRPRPAWRCRRRAPGQPSGSAGARAADPPERRSNSLIVHAKKHEVETIKRLVSQLDVNIYGGRRVFIYYAENAKSKDLATTLNAIYGARDGASTTTTRDHERVVHHASPNGRAAAAAPPSGRRGRPGAATLPEVLAEGQVRFIADEVTNAVIVTTFPRSWTEIENTIKQLDRMPRQVLIEVLVAEITLTDDIAARASTGPCERAASASSTPIRGPPGLPTTPSPPDCGRRRFFRSAWVAPPRSSGRSVRGSRRSRSRTDQFIAMLNALANENKVNIVSNPHILTSENKKAVINVSTSVPIVTSQTTGQVAAATTTPTTTTTSTTTTTAGLNQTVEYRDAGVILTVTPRIGEQGTVALDVKQEVNQIGAPVPPTNSPSFIKREAETSVVLLNNQTLVLGGLIQDKLTTTDRGIPLLKDIPLIGYMFGFTERLIEKTELLLLITPRVVGTAARRREDHQRDAPRPRPSSTTRSGAHRACPRPVRLRRHRPAQRRRRRSHRRRSRSERQRAGRDPGVRGRLRCPRTSAGACRRRRRHPPDDRRRRPPAP